jgi:eukaryotic-like serine/threonine-protein kinase
VARLQHPHIVQIYEVGEHAGGPFFSLELVEGGTLAQKLRGGPLAPESAAQLAETLALAVQYAHERGVVHRDLKPSNILLTADGVPKIADFGLAKRLDRSGGQTTTGNLVGTPNYMAPEQATNLAAEVGPVTDVYAVGAILYEMLTGRPPHLGSNLVNTLAQVCFTEAVSPRRLQPNVLRDLDTICMKCLQKEPARRYASAAALAEDLGQFLASKPIRARPVSSVERLWRWGRRKPAVAGLLLALLVAFAGGFAGVAWQWRRAEAERVIAIQEQARAEANFLRAREVVDKLTQVGEQLANQPRMEKTRRELLEEVLRFYQGFLKEKSTDPTVRFEAARASVRVGSIYRMLRQWEEAEDYLQQGEQLFARLALDYPSDTRYALERAFCSAELGHALKDHGEFQQAATTYRRSVGLWETLVAQFPADANYQNDLANVLLNLSVVLRADARPQEAQEDLFRAIELQKQLVSAFPKKARFRQGLALGYESLAILLWQGDQRAEAESACRDAIRLLQEVVASAPGSAWDRYFLERTSSYLASILGATGRSEEAEQMFRDSILQLEKLVGQSPSIPEFRMLLANDLLQLVTSYVESQQWPNALATQRRLVTQYRKLATDFPDEAVYKKDLLPQELRVGVFLRQSGQYREAIDLCRRVLKANPDSPTTQNQLAWTLVSSPDPKEGDAVQAVEYAEQAVKAAPNMGNYKHTLGVAYYRLGKYDSAVKLLEEAMELRAGGDSDDWFFLAMSYWQMGDKVQARRWRDQASEWMDEHKPEDDELRRFRAEAEAHMAELVCP